MKGSRWLSSCRTSVINVWAADRRGATSTCMPSDRGQRRSAASTTGVRSAQTTQKSNAIRTRCAMLAGRPEAMSIRIDCVVNNVPTMSASATTREVRIPSDVMSNHE
jgi:hypothetical protein